jgi:hypothetical protein
MSDGMTKRPAKATADATATLSIPERILLFFVASDILGACRHYGRDRHRDGDPL